MKYQPHQYQEYMTRRVVDQPQVGLFAEMGLGKTIATLTAIDELIYGRFEVEKVLVIAPLRVARDTWFDEVDKWDHLRRLRMVKVLGSAQERARALQKDADVYIINRENVVWLVKSLRKWPFDMVVIDELSSFKHCGSQRFRALKHVRPQMRRVIGLTGTPQPGGIVDLWPQIYLLDEGKRLGKTVTEFRRNYLYPEKMNGPVVYSYKARSGAEKEVHDRIKDLVVSLRSADWLDMPERIDNHLPIELPPEVRAQYDRLEREMILSLGDTPIVAQTAAVLSNKLLQLANGWRGVQRRPRRGRVARLKARRAGGAAGGRRGRAGVGLLQLSARSCQNLEALPLWPPAEYLRGHQRLERGASSAFAGTPGERRARA